MIIPDYPNYSIDTRGTIYLKNGKPKATSKCQKGYEHVTLCDKGKKRTFLVHRLVAILMIPNPENLPQVNHIDGDKTNNNIENLEWCTPSQNIQHSHDTGLKVSYKGEKSGQAKLTEVQVLEIKDKLSKGITQRKLAKEYSVGLTTICNINTGKKWKHL